MSCLVRSSIMHVAIGAGSDIGIVAFVRERFMLHLSRYKRIVAMLAVKNTTINSLQLSVLVLLQVRAIGCRGCDTFKIAGESNVASS